MAENAYIPLSFPNLRTVRDRSLFIYAGLENPSCQTFFSQEENNAETEEN